LERSDDSARKPWSLDAGSFDRLLAALHPDRGTASAEYERMRQRLIRFFSIQQARSPEDLADTAFNRIARRIAEGEEIRNAQQYLSGVARMLLLEDRYKRRQEEHAMRLVANAGNDPGADQELPGALEACLETLPVKSRELLERYYSAEGRARIASRQKMAEEMGMDLNALRNRASRLRDRLEECIRRRMDVKKERDIQPGIATKE
jgi:DNA-directed RNA polymerase specialized sigma24 family protein